ncbi:MAG: hypothetical protein AAB011_05635 [Candidatus Eisenbacteria bacterium]
MGYTVELMDAGLFCRSRADAEAAASIVAAHEEMYPYHVQVSASEVRRGPDTGRWYLEIFPFEGDHWDAGAAESLWLALAPHLADGAFLEFLGEGGDRWRVRWQEGRVFEEHVAQTIWEVSKEITAESLEKEES